MKRRSFLTSITAAIGSIGHAQEATIIQPDSIPLIDGQPYDGPPVTQVFVRKSSKKLFLLNGKTVLKEYDVQFGFDPVGHKHQRGDGKTPEGAYWIDRRNYESKWFVSLGISYPNSQDIERARSAGVDPGGDIFIHGTSKKRRERNRNWTAGCISMRNEDMREVFWMVQLGTPILISA